MPFPEKPRAFAVCQLPELIVASSLGSIFGDGESPSARGPHFTQAAHLNFQVLQVLGTCLVTLFVETVPESQTNKEKSKIKEQRQSPRELP